MDLNLDQGIPIPVETKHGDSRKFFPLVLTIKCVGTPSCLFCSFFAKGISFCDFLFASLEDEALPKGSTLKGKNLLLEEQILSFKS